MQKLWILTQFKNLTLMSQYFPEYSEIGHVHNTDTVHQTHP